MERNVDKIKRLEHELGRWRKKVADTAKENEKLREALAQAGVGNQETQALVDAVLTAVVLEHGERAMDPDAPETALGWRLAVPFFSVKEMRARAMRRCSQPNSFPQKNGETSPPWRRIA